MREIKWVFSFIKGKNAVLLALVWLSGIAFTGLLTIEPMIIRHIVDDILTPMFHDSSIKTEEVMGQMLPMLFLTMVPYSLLT